MSTALNHNLFIQHIVQRMKWSATAFSRIISISAAILRAISSGYSAPSSTRQAPVREWSEDPVLRE